MGYGAQSAAGEWQRSCGALKNRIASFTIVVFAGLSTCVLSTAQTTSHDWSGGRERVRAASELNTNDPEIIGRAYRHPKIDTKQALSGAALIGALRQGGYVLYMRHTQTGTVTPECAQSNLTAAGERDARFVGDSIRALRIPIDRVMSSPICRVFDTAKLLNLGAVEKTFDLSNLPLADGSNLEQARLKQLLTAPPAGKNRVLVSHLQHSTAEQDRLALDFGEIIVFRPGGPMPNAIGRVRVDDWYELAAGAASNTGVQQP